MRRGFSPTKSKVAEEMAARKEQESRREDSRRPTNPSINHWKYFCHYNNAVYQGGMSAYKKHGKGLLLHDDGAAVVTQYLHDTPTGHNIIFRDNSIASVLFKNSSEYEIAYKQGRFIIKIPFSEGNDNAHGVGVLIDYEFNKIYELIFKRGVLVDKILHLNRKNNEDVFKHNTIAKLMGLKHEQAFALTFQKPETMHIKQTGNELTIGYFDGDGEMHGLGFRSYGENIDVSGHKPLYLKSIQRGYYKRSQLETYGQKFFSNGNKYVGEFEKGQFHGHGILVCPQQMKWVYGRFANGKLSQVLDSNNKRYTQNDFQMWNEGLLDIHRRYRERWIDFRIQLPDQLYLYNILKDSVRKQVTQVDPDVQEAAKEEEYRMGRIQQQFQAGLPGDFERSYVDVELDKHYTIRTSRNSRVDTTPRRNKIDPPSNRQPIYIDDPHSSKQRARTGQITTPISRISNKHTPKNSPGSNQERGQRHYRMQDPFQIELVKVPMNKDQRDNDRFKEKLKDSIKEDYERPRLNITLPENNLYRTAKQPSSSFRYAQNLPSSYQGIYRRAYYDELEKQRDIYRRLEKQDQGYIDQLRRGISRSPVHRDYYSTPPKYDPLSTRYGKIINKKNFDYQDPHESPSRKYQREAERDSFQRESPTHTRDLNKYNRQPSPTYNRDSAKYNRQPSPSNLLGNSPYRSYKDSMGNSRTFIENNYQHWR